MTSSIDFTRFVSRRSSSAKGSWEKMSFNWLIAAFVGAGHRSLALFERSERA